MTLPPDRTGPDVACLLDLDARLLATIPVDDLDTARASTRGPVLRVDVGRWEPPETSTAAGFGLLLVDGVVMRDVALAGAGCTEVLGPGDLLRPADYQVGSVPFDVSFEVLEPARLAVLDGRFAVAVSPWPLIAEELLRRTVHRAHSLATQLAITCLTGTDVRLHAMLWHLADRWGHQDRDGVVLPLVLTHETLGRLVRGRRPAVSTALRALAASDVVVRRPDGSWLLRGDPPHPGVN